MTYPGDGSQIDKGLPARCCDHLLDLLRSQQRFEFYGFKVQKWNVDPKIPK